jgi:hypothetical protein
MEIIGFSFRERGKTNIDHEIVYYSPGFEWEYGGSEPSERALNVLHILLPIGCDDQEPVKL